MSNGDHEVSIARLEVQLDNHHEQLNGIRRDVKDVKDAVTAIDQKIAYFTGAIAIVVALIQILFKFFGA